MDKKVSLEDIVSLAKRRGFVYPSSEIYGGLSGVYDYGPLGVKLKHNIQNLWWSSFVLAWDDMYPMDAAILMNKKVWEASGHADGFIDPIVVDLKNNTRYKADQLLEDAGVNIAGMSLQDLNNAIKEESIKSPDGNDLSEVTQFNMMFKTVVGSVTVTVEIIDSDELSAELHAFKTGEEKPALIVKQPRSKVLNSSLFYDRVAVSYLRPETAQGMFVNFKNILDTVQPDMPFGLAQIGKAFRNEISPRDWLFRLREMEQMEIEYFVHPDKWEEAFEQWRAGMASYFQKVGLPEDMVHEKEVSEDERAHYSKRTIDFEFDFPFGRKELAGLAYRTDYDLKKHQEASGVNLAYQPKDGSQPFIPHVVEPSFGVERLVLAVLTAAYSTDEQGGEKRTYLKLPAEIAPVKVAVFPLLKNKPELIKKAREVYDKLKEEFAGAVMWDDNGNIGKRYRRQDEIGTPHTITIDFQTLEDDTVTVRDRDTTKQRRVKASELSISLQ